MKPKRIFAICEECQNKIGESGIMGPANLLFLRSVGQLKTVPKKDCERCQKLKEKK